MDPYDFIIFGILCVVCFAVSFYEAATIPVVRALASTLLRLAVVIGLLCHLRNDAKYIYAGCVAVADPAFLIAFIRDIGKAFANSAARTKRSGGK